MIRRKRKNLEDVESALLDSLDEPPIRGVVPSFRPRGPQITPERGRPLEVVHPLLIVVPYKIPIGRLD